MTLDPVRLGQRLDDEFGGKPGEQRVVTRQAVDLHDAGKYATDTGTELTVEEIIDHLGDAPEQTLAERWNWWMGALDVAYGGYERFSVRRYPE